MTLYEEDDNPLTFTPSQLVDPRGDFYLINEDDPTEAIEDNEEVGVGLGFALQSSRNSLIYNGDFAQGPPRPDEAISDTNPLPYWRLTRVQGGIDAYWVTDSSGPAGYAIEWRAGPTIDNTDESYLEQIIPVSPGSGILAPMMTMDTATSSTTLLASEGAAQFLTIDGSTTGSERSYLSTWDQTAQSFRFAQAVIPSDARFLRIRVNTQGYVGAYTGSSTRHLLQVWAAEPEIAYATISGESTTLPATGTQNVDIAGGLAAAAARFVMPSAGWVASVSAQTSGTVAGADLDFYVWNITSSTQAGPTATVEVDEDKGYATEAPISATFLTAGTEVKFRLEVPTGTLTNTTDDIQIHAVIGLLIYKDSKYVSGSIIPAA